ncbi:hypothetical protein LZ30DRAFT_712110 [Colletotrichum cereale]|nr:hypothetical protein LZ30DRAFT_712110 [Colletotrichum cereale]
MARVCCPTLNVLNFSSPGRSSHEPLVAQIPIPTSIAPRNWSQSGCSSEPRTQAAKAPFLPLLNRA